MVLHRCVLLDFPPIHIVRFVHCIAGRFGGIPSWLNVKPLLDGGGEGQTDAGREKQTFCVVISLFWMGLIELMVVQWLR